MSIYFCVYSTNILYTFLCILTNPLFFQDSSLSLRMITFRIQIHADFLQKGGFKRIFYFSVAYIVLTMYKECVSANEGLHRGESFRVSPLYHQHQFNREGRRKKIPSK